MVMPQGDESDISITVVYNLSLARDESIRLARPHHVRPALANFDAAKLQHSRATVHTTIYICGHTTDVHSSILNMKVMASDHA